MRTDVESTSCEDQRPLRRWSRRSMLTRLDRQAEVSENPPKDRGIGYETEDFAASTTGAEQDVDSKHTLEQLRPRVPLETHPARREWWGFLGVGVDVFDRLRHDLCAVGSSRPQDSMVGHQVFAGPGYEGRELCSMTLFPGP